jgi:hypothetical protein
MPGSFPKIYETLISITVLLFISKNLFLEYTDPHNDPMIPHTFILKPNLIIHKIYCGYWYWGRPSTVELHQDLRDITREIRPDYRIDTEEMKEKWEDKSKKKENFYPYGKSWQKVFAEMSWSVDKY